MDTVSVFSVVVGLVALAWAIADGAKRRRRASAELAARRAAQEVEALKADAATPLNMKLLWLDDERRDRIARNVMEQVAKHHDHPEYKH